MDTSLANLSDEDLDILIQECTHEISQAKSRLGSLIIERDLLRRKIGRWTSELNYLVILREVSRSGEKPITFSHPTPDDTTLRTLRKRHAELMERYRKISS